MLHFNNLLYHFLYPFKPNDYKLIALYDSGFTTSGIPIAEWS